MKRLVFTFVALAVLAPIGALASTWGIDPVHTTLQFKVRHLMISNVKGHFEKFTGKLDLDDKDITRSRVDITIETPSLNTNIQKRDEDLRSDNFFDVAKFPTMSFTSTKVEKVGANKLKVSGNLTIKGNTRPVVLDVDGLTPEIKDPWGGTRRGASATATINRKDFGLTWNKTMDNGGMVVGEEVAIQLEVEFVKN
jgi:polyisoprenoid-binding protein YceI